MRKEFASRPISAASPDIKVMEDTTPNGYTLALSLSDYVGGWNILQFWIHVASPQGETVEEWTGDEFDSVTKGRPKDFAVLEGYPEALKQFKKMKRAYSTLAPGAEFEGSPLGVYKLAPQTVEKEDAARVEQEVAGESQFEQEAADAVEELIDEGYDPEEAFSIYWNTIIERWTSRSYRRDGDTSIRGWGRPKLNKRVFQILKEREDNTPNVSASIKLNMRKTAAENPLSRPRTIIRRAKVESLP